MRKFTISNIENNNVIKMPALKLKYGKIVAYHAVFIQKYLSRHDLKRLYQASRILRKLFRQFVWEKCVIIQRDTPPIDTIEPYEPTYEPINIKIFFYPQKYQWFKPHSVKLISFGYSDEVEWSQKELDGLNEDYDYKNIKNEYYPNLRNVAYYNYDNFPKFINFVPLVKYVFIEFSNVNSRLIELIESGDFISGITGLRMREVEFCDIVEFFSKTKNLNYLEYLEIGGAKPWTLTELRRVIEKVGTYERIKFLDLRLLYHPSINNLEMILTSNNINFCLLRCKFRKFPWVLVDSEREKTKDYRRTVSTSEIFSADRILQQTQQKEQTDIELDKGTEIPNFFECFSGGIHSRLLEFLTSTVTPGLARLIIDNFQLYQIFESFSSPDCRNFSKLITVNYVGLYVEDTEAFFSPSYSSVIGSINFLIFFFGLKTLDLQIQTLRPSFPGEEKYKIPWNVFFGNVVKSKKNLDEAFDFLVLNEAFSRPSEYIKNSIYPIKLYPKEIDRLEAFHLRNNNEGEENETQHIENRKLSIEGIKLMLPRLAADIEVTRASLCSPQEYCKETEQFPLFESPVKWVQYYHKFFIILIQTIGAMASLSARLEYLTVDFFQIPIFKNGKDYKFWEDFFKLNVNVFTCPLFYQLLATHKTLKQVNLINCPIDSSWEIDFTKSFFDSDSMLNDSLLYSHLCTSSPMALSRGKNEGGYQKRVARWKEIETERDRDDQRIRRRQNFPWQNHTFILNQGFLKRSHNLFPNQYMFPVIVDLEGMRECRNNGDNNFTVGCATEMIKKRFHENFNSYAFQELLISGPKLTSDDCQMVDLL